MAAVTFTDRVPLACRTSCPVVAAAGRRPSVFDRGQEDESLSRVWPDRYGSCSLAIWLRNVRPEPKIRCTNAPDLIY